MPAPFGPSADWGTWRNVPAGKREEGPGRPARVGVLGTFPPTHPAHLHERTAMAKADGRGAGEPAHGKASGEPPKRGGQHHADGGAGYSVHSNRTEQQRTGAGSAGRVERS
jgi:hypothetical protein